MLEGSKTEDYLEESEQWSDKEGGHPAEKKPPSEDEREEELIHNPELWGLGFKENA